MANAQAIVEQFRAQETISEIPIGEKMLIELYRDGDLSHYFFHSLIGRSANDALSRIVALRVKKRIGGNALVTIDDYGFLLTLRHFQELSLPEWKECFVRAGAEEDLRSALRRSELVKWQFRGVAQTGLMVPRNLPGRQRKQKQMNWSAEVLFRVLEEHEPDHPLLREAYRQATHTFLDAEAAFAFLEEVKSFDWRLLRACRHLAVFISDLRQRDQGKHDAGRSGERARAHLSRDVREGGIRGGRERRCGLTTMQFKDHFSGHASDYAQFRPHYPRELFAISC